MSRGQLSLIIISSSLIVTVDFAFCFLVHALLFNYVFNFFFCLLMLFILAITLVFYLDG